MYNTLFLNFLFAFVLLLSCTKDQPSIEEPAFYTFTRNGTSTVSFSGQTSRILMAEELATSLLDFSKTETELLDMFANENKPFSSEDLNNSGKSIQSKVAASKDFFSSNTAASAKIRQQLEEWISLQIQEIGAESDKLAMKGSSGQIVDGNTVRYIGMKGLEYNQAIAKGLIGALMVDQTLNNYLSSAVLDAGNNKSDNDATTTEEGKAYTSMEHKWDEAYGYVFGTSLDKTNPLKSIGTDDNFLNKYIGRVESDADFEGIAKDIFDAFKLGRAAIVARDYEVRDEQAEVLRELISKIIGIRAVYYLQQGKRSIESQNYGTAFHDLSEGFGFIYSLQFTREPNTSEPYLSAEKIDSFLDKLLIGDGFWDVSPETLDQISSEISEEFNFNVEQAAE
jgi:hypothetical protein